MSALPPRQGPPGSARPGLSAERAGFEPAQPRFVGWPPGSNRAPCQARSPLHDGPGGIRTHTTRLLRPPPLPIGLRTRVVPAEGFEPATSRLSTWRLCHVGLHRRMVGAEGIEPSGWRSHDGSTARPVSIAVYAPVAKNEWRRVEESNPRQVSLSPWFSGPVAAPRSGTLQKRKKPPRLNAGGLSRIASCCS